MTLESFPRCPATQLRYRCSLTVGHAGNHLHRTESFARTGETIAWDEPPAPERVPDVVGAKCPEPLFKTGDRVETVSTIEPRVTGTVKWCGRGPGACVGVEDDSDDSEWDFNVEQVRLVAVPPERDAPCQHGADFPDARKYGAVHPQPSPADPTEAQGPIAVSGTAAEQRPESVGSVGRSEDDRAVRMFDEWQRRHLEDGERPERAEEWPQEVAFYRRHLDEAFAAGSASSVSRERVRECAEKLGALAERLCAARLGRENVSAMHVIECEGAARALVEKLKGLCDAE